MDSGISLWEALHATSWTKPDPPTPPAPLSPTHPATHLSIVSSTPALDQLKDVWNSLFAISPTAAPPLRFNWVKHWWQLYGPVYGDNGNGLRVLAIHRGSVLIGALPLYLGFRNVAGIRVKRLTCITAGADEFEETSADYLGLLHAPNQESACIDAVAAALKSQPDLDCDELHFPNLSHLSPLTSLINDLAGPRSRAAVVNHTLAHRCDLRGGFDEYLKRLSPRNRKNARAILRDADSPGLTFEVAATPDRAAAFFDQLVSLHRQRWAAKGQSGSFAPRHAQFHRTVLLEGTSTGDTVIARLAHHDTPVALFYGHRAGDTFHCYQQGTNVDADFGLRSPGIAASLLLMRHLAATGTQFADFQQGPNPYKERFCNQTHPLEAVHMVRTSLRCFSFALAQIGERALRKAVRTSRGLLADPSPSD